jgi:hypothetical protein
MFAMDTWEKTIVQAALEHNGCAPGWLGDLSTAVSVLPPQSLCFEHESGMTITGRTDDVFELPDETLGLVDYKTAAFRGEDDPLFIKYAVQLGLYAILLEEKFSKKVSKTGLVYFQAETKAEGADALTHLTDSGISVDFSAHWLPVKVNRKQVSQLLTEAYELATTNEPPEAGAGCKECAKLLRITELLEGIKEPLTDVVHVPGMSRQDLMRLQSRTDSRRSRMTDNIEKMQTALQEVRRDAPWSVIGQWDFTDDTGF